jgi:hypothetical protein
MTYRDDRDADRARIEALEQELAAARRRIEELEARKPAVIERIEQRTLAPRGPRATTWHRGGRLLREYVFDRPLPLEACRDLVRTLGERIGRRGRIEIGARRAAWLGGGRRFELELGDGATVLTCADRRSANARTACIVTIVVLLALCVSAPGVISIGGSFFAAMVACAAAIQGEPARAEESHTLFEHVAELVEGELRRALPPGPAIAAGDEDAR